MRPARATIDLDALRHNYRHARTLGGGWVRPGLMLYGSHMLDAPGAEAEPLRAVMALGSKVIAARSRNSPYRLLTGLKRAPRQVVERS